MYKLICMAFDGEYVTEHETFETIDETWNYSNDLGSKWCFFPFHFVITESGKTVKSSSSLLEFCNNKRLKTIQKMFEQVSKLPEAQNMDAEDFAFLLNDIYA